MTKTRGVRGAAGWCGVAAVLYLLVRAVLYAAVNAAMRLLQTGASLSAPVGFSTVTVELLQILIGLASLLLPMMALLRATRLEVSDLRITLPAPWSPAFCLTVFLGLANAANLIGTLLTQLLGSESGSDLLYSGGPELALQFIALCLVPAVTEELLFRGALQGLLRPCGSAAAIFGPALLFGLLHLDLAQGLTAFVCGVFLGWLTERSGSILPGMLLHFINNCLAFFTLYLRFYASTEASLAAELFILLFFPLFGGWLILHARGQGFRFSAGLRPGVDAVSVFTSPAYSLTVLFLIAYMIYLR